MPEPELVLLALPDHPTSEDVAACNTTKKQAISALEATGINPDAPLSDTNRNRVLTRFMRPYLENLQEITRELMQRADLAQELLDKGVERPGLLNTIIQVRKLARELEKYRELAENARGIDDVNQRKFLSEMVYSPIFRGSGHTVPGDDTSPWKDFISLYCRPIIYGAAIERSLVTVPPGALDPSKQPKRGSYALGALVLAGVGLLLLRK